MFAQLITSGVAIGSLYALIALAMVIIYKTSKVLNFAQGDMAMVSTFVAYMLLESYSLPFPAAFGLSLLFAFLLGMAIEFLFLRHAEKPTILGLIVITLGCEMIHIVASANLQRKVDLEEASDLLDNVMYEPEQFPGMIYRISSPKVVFLLFSSGKIICTGAQNVEDIHTALGKLAKKLEGLGIDVTPVEDN